MLGNQNPEETKDTDKRLAHMPKVVYKSRTDFLISKLNQEEDLDTEDHIVQLPWQPEQMPTNEELKKRQEIRKE